MMTDNEEKRTMATEGTKRTVCGVKTAVALVEHEPAEVGFCSLRTVTFDPDGRVTVSITDLTHDEADRLYRGLADLLGAR